MRLSTPQDVRLYADEIIGHLEIFATPRTEAILHVLRFAQSMQSMGEFKNGPWAPSAYREMRVHQDVLRHLIFQIYQRCPLGGHAHTVSQQADMERANEAVKLFIVYSMLHDNLESVEAGHSTCRIAGETIQFDSHLPESFLARAIYEDENRRASSLRSPEEELNLEHLRYLKGKVRVGSDLRLRYDVTDQMFSLFFRPELPTLFPESLTLGPYTWGQFHQFCQYLKSLAELRRFLLAIARKELGTNFPYNEGALVVEDRELKKMRHRIGIRHEPARALLDDLTYSPTTAKDVIQQPLLVLTQSTRVTAPLLIYGSNHERNLLLLIERVRPEGAKAVNEAKERLMISELQPHLEKLGFQVKERLRLGTRTKPIGDIDLLVWNKDATFALAISLKWFFGPDSMYEVRMHDSKFREALDVHRRCLHELEENKVALSKNFRLEPPLTGETRVKGVIVSQMATPSEMVSDPDIPIITSEEFKIRAVGSDLSSLYDSLARIRAALPIPLGTASFREDRLGKYNIKFPIFVRMSG